MKGGLAGQFLDCGKTVLVVLLDQRQLDCQLGIAVSNIPLAQKCKCFRIVGHLPKQRCQKFLLELLGATKRVNEQNNQCQIDVLFEM